MSETAELKKRLEALEGKPQNAKARPSVVTIALGIGAIVALGGLLLLFSGGSEPESLETASPDEFQAAGPGFGDLELTPAPIDTSPPPTESEPESETEELRAQMDAMRSELEALRNAPAPEAPTVDTDAHWIPWAQRSMPCAARQQQRKPPCAKSWKNAHGKSSGCRTIWSLHAWKRRARPHQPAPRPRNCAFRSWNGGGKPNLRNCKPVSPAQSSPLAALVSGNNETAAQQRRLDGDTDFVRNGAEPAEVTQAQVIVNPSNTVVQGTMIQAVLETAIDSSLAGQVRAMVSEDVHAYDGSRVLIPRGARLIGRYQSGLDIAQQRVTIAWDRIILPSNQTVEISAFGGDELGRSGTTGFVDSRFGTRFGSAALISLIGALPAVAAQNIEDEITSDVLEGIGEDLQDSAQSVIGEYLSVSPVIYVDQGARVTVMVDRDLEIF